MDPVTIGVIGGSGLYDMAELKVEEKVKLTTPFGEPSDEIIIGALDGRRVAFLPRHGRGHRIPPTHINYRANIWALKMLGVERIIASGACGSFKDELPPGRIVVIDQFIDRTRNRISTFSGPGLVAHVLFADPVCGDLAQVLHAAAVSVKAPVTMGGTYVCMEGPQFSTRAESKLYKSWGADVIGMTNLTEAKLAREAEICYASLALVTDFDCWHEVEADVTIEAVLAVMHQNTDTFRSIIRAAVPRIPPTRACPCKDAMQFAVITDPGAIPERTRKDLALVLGKYHKG
jgi:5'-methylthioadenosine phosphorylase